MSYDNIRVNTQSSIRIEGPKTIYFDPFEITGEAHDADLICITHSHYDHFDPESIEKIRGAGTEFAAPESMAKELKGICAPEKLHLVSPGETIDIMGLSIETVPAYNRIKPFHPKRNGWVGYILEMDGNRYYVSGDTDAVKELENISCDVALIPIGGTYTMTAKEAAGLINRMRPAAAIPTHYGSIVGKPGDADAFKSMVSSEIQVVMKLSF